VLRRRDLRARTRRRRVRLVRARAPMHASRVGCV
jgi:hypothetical protein